MFDLPKQDKEVQAILENIDKEMDELVEVNGLPINKFRLAHQKCITQEEEAGYLITLDVFVVVDGARAFQEMCVNHGVYSARYAKDNPLHKTIDR